MLVYTTDTLPNEIIPYHHKLQLLKQKPDQTKGYRLVFKNSIKSNFFILVTIILLLSILMASFLSRVNQAKLRVAENNSLLSLKLKSLFELSGGDRQNNLNSIKNTLLSSVQPVISFVGGADIVNKDLDKIQDVSSAWLTATDSLNQYTFSAEGFNHNTDPSRSFTKDLEIFFDELPMLKSRTERVWGELWFYKFAASISSDSKAKSAIALVDQAIAGIDSVIKLKPLILESLGHYSTQRMVIFNQNTGEARPTGGFIGSHIPIDISQGRMKIGESQSIFYIDGQATKTNLTHPAAWYYGYYYNDVGFGGAQNSNFFNCFPETAKLLEDDFVNSKNGYSIDQLLMINPQLLQNLLPYDFDFNVPEIGNITKQNFLSEVERVSSFQAPDRSNPKSLLSSVFKGLLLKIPEIIKQEGLSVVLSKIIFSVAARDLNIWFRNPTVQSASESLGFASEQVCEDKQKKNIITPLLVNISGDKRGLISQNNFAITSTRTWGGQKIKVSYIQNLPESKNLQRGFQDIIVINMIGLQIPQNAYNISVSGSHNLNLPFLREGYLDELKTRDQRRYVLSSAIQTTIDTGRNLKDGGFTYNQPDGSLVAGSYVSDNNVGETVVNFEFTLPIQSGESVIFYGQPGLNEPSLFLGEGVDIYKNSEIRQVTDSQIIQSGVRLVTR